MSPNSSGSDDGIGEVVRDRHQEAARQCLSRTELDHYIGGEWVSGARGQQFKTYDPTTGEQLAQVEEGHVEDVDRAVEAAWAAYRERWQATTPADRQRVLTEIADRIEAEHETFATIESLDNGKPITEAREDIDLVVDHFRYFAGASRVIEGKTIASTADQHIQTFREPYGVVGQIIPWNFPLLMAAWKLAPALAAGNTVVLKPAEETPLSILELMWEVDDVLPDGVVNVVTGHGPNTGDPLVRHDDVPKIAFTGSTEVGRGVMKGAASTISDITLELGGKSPLIVFPDADVATAVEQSLRAMFFNGGECCCAGTRLFVHEDIADEFLPAFVAAVEDLTLGDPLLESTDLGPQATYAEVDKTMQYVDSLEDDVTIHTGGERPDDPFLRKGCFVTPTVMSDVDHEARAAQEEIFGPVELVFRWADYDDMIARANDVEYGLAAGVVTNDLERAYETAADVDAGNVWVNTYNKFPAGQPFGGYKQSGMGREIGQEALGEYTQTKTVTIDTS